MSDHSRVNEIIETPTRTYLEVGQQREQRAQACQQLRAAGHGKIASDRNRSNEGVDPPSSHQKRPLALNAGL